MSKDKINSGFNGDKKPNNILIKNNNPYIEISIDPTIW